MGDRQTQKGEKAGVTDTDDQTQRESQARTRRQMRDGGAENKAESAPSNRETEAKKKITVSRPTYLGAGSPQSQWKSLPSSPRQRPYPFVASPGPTKPPRVLAPAPLTRLPGSAAPQDGQVDFEGRALLPTARAGFPKHRGHGDAAKRDAGPRPKGPNQRSCPSGPSGAGDSGLPRHCLPRRCLRPGPPGGAGCVPAARPERGGGGAGAARRAGPPRAPPNSL